MSRVFIFKTFVTTGTITIVIVSTILYQALRVFNITMLTLALVRLLLQYSPVFQMRCMLNIWGVMLFLRVSWMVGQCGLCEYLNGVYFGLGVSIKIFPNANIVIF